MADNTTLDTMSGGDVIATDDISGVKYQRMKLIFGADGVNSGDVSSSNGLPVTLLAGSASIGILGANSGVDIGDVTINNSTGGSAVNIQDGGNSITVDSLADKVDDAAFTPGTTSVRMAGFEYDDTGTDSVDEGDAGAARMSANRNIYVQIRDAAGNERGLAIDSSNRLTALAVQSGTWILGANSGVDIGDVTINNSTGGSAVNIQDGGNTITVDGTVTADTELPAAGAQADNVSDPTTTGINVYPAFRDGSDGNWDRARALNASLNTSAAGSGIQGVGLIAQLDNTSPTTITENNFGNVRMSDERSLHTELRDARGREFGAEIDYQGRFNVNRVSDVVTVSGNVALEPQRQPINISATGTLISGTTNRKIRVLNGVLMAPTAVTINLKSNNNTDMVGPMALGANGGFQIPEAEIGDFETRVGEPLTISMSTPTQVGGWLTYILV